MAFVLIFDANEAHALRAFDALAAAGHACGWVTDIDQASRVLQRRAPDLILLDQAIPGAEGENLPARLRRLAEVEDLPIILLAGTAPAASAGWITDEIRKPFDPGFLIWRINHALERYGRTRSLQGIAPLLAAGGEAGETLRLHA